MKKNQISIRVKLLILSMLILSASGLIAYLITINNENQANSRKWITHTEAVIDQSDKAFSFYKDMEAAALSYVITNDSTFLKQYWQAKANAYKHIAEVKKLTSDNMQQQLHLDSLDLCMHQRIDYLMQTINIKNEEGIAKAIAFISAPESKKYTANIHYLTNAIRQNELILLDRRTQVSDDNVVLYNRYLIALYIFMSALAVFIVIASGKYMVQNMEKNNGAFRLSIATKRLTFQHDERELRAAELVIANKELIYQNTEKEHRAAELIVANKELLFHNNEKEHRAAELIIANKELLFQNEEKEKRAAELVIANKELAFQNDEKESRAAELVIANIELAFQNNEKEKKVTERTKMIADIVQRNKDLEQFSYIVSHNLRAPVANILGIVNVLQTIEMDHKETVQATSYLSIAARNLDNVITDINAILELNNKVNEKREIIIFQPLVDEIKFSLGHTPAHDMPDIKCDFSAIAGMIAIKSYLHSIFFNLISNSIKYRKPDQKPVIAITSALVDDKVQLIFKDNGLGIDLARDGENIFGLYKRFHSHVDGKGMGLYMVKAHVISLGGNIIVSSKVNEGTEFRIELANN